MGPPWRVQAVDRYRCVESEDETEERVKKSEPYSGAAFQKAADPDRDQKCGDENDDRNSRSLCVEQRAEHFCAVYQRIGRARPPGTPDDCRGRPGGPSLPLSILARTVFRSLFRQLLQPLHDLTEQDFVFEIELVIEVGAEPIFLGLAVLRHHDDWCLN